MGTWWDTLTSHPAAAGTRLGTLAPSCSPSHQLGSGVVTGKTKAQFSHRESLLLLSPPQSCRCLCPLPDAITPSGLRGWCGAGAWMVGFPSSPRAGAWECQGPGSNLVPTRVPRSFWWDGGAQPRALHGMHDGGHDSQLSAMLAGALLSKPRRDPRHSWGTPLPPSPSPLTAASPSSQTKFLLLPPGWSCLPLPS